MRRLVVTVVALAALAAGCDWKNTIADHVGCAREVTCQAQGCPPPCPPWLR